VKQPLLAAAAALPALFPICLHAEETQSETIVVTATRTARTVDDTLAAVTVLTRADIERSQAQSLIDLLRGLPGLSLANNGGIGKNTSVFLRGTESDHVLVLIDGIKIGSATTGQAAFQDLPLEEIERIEIVRGPRSSLYGSEAIGGVIQIFTRRGGGAPKPRLAVGAGRYKTHNAAAGLSGGGERAWFDISADRIHTGGFNACNGPGGCFTIEPDDDGYRRTAGSLRAGYRLAGGTELDFHLLRAAADNEYDGSFVNESKPVQQVAGARLRFTPAPAWQASLTAGRSRDESDNYKDGAFKSRFDTRRDTISLQNDFTLGARSLLTAGLDYQNDEVLSTTAYRVTTRDNKGVFTQYQTSLGEGHDLQASLRADRNEQFGRHTTGGLAWGWRLGGAGGGTRLTLSYGTAFKAPTFNELYFPGYGNPNLRPEKARSTELAASGSFGRASGSANTRWSLNAFQTEIDDLIAFDASLFAPANIDRARIRGVEAGLTGVISGFDLRAGLTWLDPENRAPGANFGKVLPRRARQAFRLDLDRAFGSAARLGATLVAEGRRYDDLANTRAMGGYATLDLRAEYALAPAWRLQARLENAFDKKYETAAFYNQPGRGLYVTVRYQP
jgi:vitamin B12 transporter